MGACRLLELGLIEHCDCGEMKHCRGRATNILGILCPLMAIFLSTSVPDLPSLLSLGNILGLNTQRQHLKTMDSPLAVAHLSGNHPSLYFMNTLIHDFSFLSPKKLTQPFPWWNMPFKVT